MAHQSEGAATDTIEPIRQSAQVDDDGLAFMQLSMRQILEKLNQQERDQRLHSERESTIQTILLLDRMGLLKGGLPRDVASLARVLEDSRETIRATGSVLDTHLSAERERTRRLLRDRVLAKRRT